eukprot:NODE_10974_length_319_cov_17.496296_g10061_i0.p1 GENE.NODE_10974_length_319_cov_17.496296_g10061_i0~~NODE_10974_length_319_cov_17.496296_g10061_i0.p1  ORF type:complete len:78 (+),score=19.28 NODE_10974_length_319_cov_17.496296_g10061_i0:42-275(+)
MRINLDCVEEDLELFDALTADEIFITSTSWGVCGVANFNGRPVGEGAPGPVTLQLLEAFKCEAGYDYVEQYSRQSNS